MFWLRFPYYIFCLIFKPTYVIMFEVSFLWTTYTSVRYFNHFKLWLLSGIFRSFAINVIIDILELSQPFYFLFSVLFFTSPLSSSYLPVDYEQSLELYFYLSIVFLNISLCIAFLVIALGILHIHNLSVWDILSAWVKYQSLSFLYFPLPSLIYNIIVLNISSTYVWNHIRSYYNSCFKCQALFRKLKRRMALSYSYFYCVLLFFFPNVLRSLLLLFPVC